MCKSDQVAYGPGDDIAAAVQVAFSAFRGIQDTRNIASDRRFFCDYRNGSRFLHYRFEDSRASGVSSEILNEFIVDLEIVLEQEPEHVHGFRGGRNSAVFADFTDKIPQVVQQNLVLPFMAAEIGVVKACHECFLGEKVALGVAQQFFDVRLAQRLRPACVVNKGSKFFVVFLNQLQSYDAFVIAHGRCE
jgi:hypothetical protein